MEPAVSCEIAAPPTEKEGSTRVDHPASQLLHCAAFYARFCTLYRRRACQREFEGASKP